MKTSRKRKPADWRDRAIAATNGNGSQFGAILLCAMGRNNPDMAPRFVGKASVTSDRFVICGFVDRNGNGHHGAFVGALSDLESNARGLAQHLGLTDSERSELFAMLRQWIGTNYSGVDILTG